MVTGPFAGSGSGTGLGHAVVIGASMAGLLAARALAGHVERVTVVERDALPAGAEHRTGVPQGRQLHILLARGRQVIEGFFPGYREQLLAAGAVPVQVPADVLVLGPAGLLDRRATGWEALSASRLLIEAAVRCRLRDLPGITFLERHEVTGLVASRDGREVRGVEVRSRDAGSGGCAHLEADLVVDASGRGSRAAAWLAALGYPGAALSEVDPNIAYASRIYQMPDGCPDGDWRAVMLSSQPPSMPRSGYLFPIEGGRWMVSMMGTAGQHPPTDEEGWWAFIRSLRSPVIADALVGAEPLAPVRGHRGTANRQWHLERMTRRPERFVVLGDAVCAFNPVYGQGMSTAAVAAETLDGCLAEHLRDHSGRDLAGLAVRFQRRLARRNASSWALSTGEDLRFPSTTGMRAGPVLRARHRYLDRLALAATTDTAVAEAYVRVVGMLDEPTVLFRPRVLVAAFRPHSSSSRSAPDPRPAEDP
jgi:2-polyprenyl-6-methoxyphenol hydroxylase-like FAD-dependent oxidoreductase